MTNAEFIVLCNEAAYATWYSFFFSTPYATGNLARSIGDVGQMDLPPGAIVGFKLFDANQRAPYGAILNEASVINGSSTNMRTGETKRWSYPNKHYQWVDKFFEQWASEISLYVPIRRIL